MINIISAILFSFSANIDNIVIGISYGINKIKINFITNLIIAVFTSIITTVSMKFACFLFIFISEYTANLIGAIGLVILGLTGIISFITSKHQNTNHCLNFDNCETPITFYHMLKIIITLSFNNIASGMAASIAGVNLLASFFATLLFSFLLLFVGNTLGTRIKSIKIKKYSELLSSFILILLGILQILFN